MLAAAGPRSRSGCQPSDLKVVARTSLTPRAIQAAIDHRGRARAQVRDVAGQRDGAFLGDYLPRRCRREPARSGPSASWTCKSDVDSGWRRSIADLYVVPDVAEADQPGDSPFGGGAPLCRSPTVPVSVRFARPARSASTPVRHGGRSASARCFAAVVSIASSRKVVVGQHHLQVVSARSSRRRPAGAAAAASRYCGLARHGAVERHVPHWTVHDMNVRVVDERIKS